MNEDNNEDVNYLNIISTDPALVRICAGAMNRESQEAVSVIMFQVLVDSQLMVRWAMTEEVLNKLLLGVEKFKLRLEEGGMTSVRST